MVTISKQSAGILYVLTILRGVGPALQPWESILENHRKNQLIIHIAIVATSWPYDKSNPFGGLWNSRIPIQTREFSSSAGSRQDLERCWSKTQAIKPPSEKEEMLKLQRTDVSSGLAKSLQLHCFMQEL